MAAKAEAGAPDGAGPDPGGLRGVLVIAGKVWGGMARFNHVIING
jgi:hypothetical protein